MVPIPYVIRRVQRETRDTFTLELVAAAEQSTVGPFLPGQFNMLYAFGVGEVPISVSGDPARPDSLVHTVRAVGSVTEALCRGSPGGMLGVRGPFGTCWPVGEAAAGDVVLVAGGLGLAPLRPALYHVLNHRSDYGNVALIYGARTPEDLLYRRELDDWCSRGDLQVEVTVDTGEKDWRGRVGVVTTLIGRVAFDPARTTALVCGPEIMMRYTVMELLKHDVGEDRIFVSLERNMKCGAGLCGHCQLGPFFICRDGPVMPHWKVRDWIGRREA